MWVIVSCAAHLGQALSKARRAKSIESADLAAEMTPIKHQARGGVIHPKKATVFNV